MHALARVLAVASILLAACAADAPPTPAPVAPAAPAPPVVSAIPSESEPPTLVPPPLAPVLASSLATNGCGDIYGRGADATMVVGQALLVPLSSLRADPKASNGLKFVAPQGEDTTGGPGHIEALVTHGAHRWAVYAADEPEGPFEQAVYEWVGARWKRTSWHANGPKTSVLLAPFGEGALLLLRHPHPKTEDLFQFHVLGDKAAAPAMPPGPPREPVALVTTLRGRVLLLSRQSMNHLDQPVMTLTIWEVGARAPNVVIVPKELEDATLVADDRRVVLGSGNTFAVLDGKGWLPLPMPAGMRGSFALSDDGALWIVTGDRVLRRGTDSDVGERRLDLQKYGRDDLSASTSLTAVGNELWIRLTWLDDEPVDHGYHCQMLRSPASTSPAVTLPSANSAKAFLAEQSPFVVDDGGGSCGSSLVTLSTAPASAKAEYDYPQTRAALRGHPELAKATLWEVMREGRRMLVAKLESRAEAAALLALVKSALPAAHPILACATVLPLRVFDVDMATGEVRKVTAAAQRPGIVELR